MQSTSTIQSTMHFPQHHSIYQVVSTWMCILYSMVFTALVYNSGSQNILINDWYACLHVLSKQLAVWNAQFVCWVITTISSCFSFDPPTHWDRSNKYHGSVIYRPVHYTITDIKRISAVMKLLAALAFNWIVLRVTFGLTSYEELLPALVWQIVWWLIYYCRLHGFQEQN